MECKDTVTSPSQSLVVTKKEMLRMMLLFLFGKGGYNQNGLQCEPFVSFINQGGHPTFLLIRARHIFLSQNDLTSLEVKADITRLQLSGGLVFENIDSEKIRSAKQNIIICYRKGSEINGWLDRGSE